MDFDFEKVVAAFLAESEESLEQMEQSLIAVENDPANNELLNDVFRTAHTIKGNASALEFLELAEFAHHLEDLLDVLRNGWLPISKDNVTLLLHSVDALRTLVPAAAIGKKRLSPSHLKLRNAIEKIASEAHSHRGQQDQGNLAIPESRHLENELTLDNDGVSTNDLIKTLNHSIKTRTLRVDMEK